MLHYEKDLGDDKAIINSQGRRAYSILGIGCVVFLVLGMFILPLLLSTIISKLFPSLAGNFILQTPLTYAGMYLIAFPLLLVIVKKLPEHKSEMCPQKKPGFLTILGYYALSYAIISVIGLAVNLIETYIIGSSGTTTVTGLLDSGTPQWVFAITGCIIAPIMEEIIFRLIPYNKASGYGTGLYIVWTGIMFGLLHLNFGQALYAMCLGFLFAKIMCDTGKIKYTILIHVMTNITGGVGIGGYVIASGNELALNIYSGYTLLLMVAGLVVGIVMLVKRNKNKSPIQAENVMTDKKRAFLNPGTIIYSVICIAFIIFMFFV